MSEPGEEFARLKAMHESTVLLKEGGKPAALLPGVQFHCGRPPRNDGPIARALRALRLHHAPVL